MSCGKPTKNQKAEASKPSPSNEAKPIQEASEIVAHNIKTCLNSLSVGLGLAIDRLGSSEFKGIRRSIELLESPDQPGITFTDEEKGTKIIAYMKGSIAQLEERRRSLQERLRQEKERVGEISAYLRLQMDTKGEGVDSPQTLDQVIRNCIVLTLGNRSDIETSVDFSPLELGETPFEESKDLTTILLNLLTNAGQAVQSSPPTDQPGISVKVEKRKAALLIEIHDNGPGVPPEDVRNLFEKGFTTKKSGNGLGLSQSRALAKARGWTLAYNPCDNSGATFTLSIPPEEKP